MNPVKATAEPPILRVSAPLDERTCLMQLFDGRNVWSHFIKMVRRVLHGGFIRAGVYLDNLRELDSYEDLYQEVGLKISTGSNLERFRDTEQLENGEIRRMMFWIAHSTGVNYIRKKSRVPETVEYNEDFECNLRLSSTRSNNPAQLMQDAQTIVWLLSSVTKGRTSDAFKVMSLLYIKELKYKEIAEITGQAEVSIRNMHMYYLGKLRNEYDRAVVNG